MSLNQKKTSYSFNGWLRLKTLCAALKQTEHSVAQLKSEIEQRLTSSQKARQKRCDIQSYQARISQAEFRLESQKCKVRTTSAILSLSRRKLGEKAARLKHFAMENEGNLEKIIYLQRIYVSTRERILWSRAQLGLRRRQLLQEISQIYYIQPCACPLPSKPQSRCCKEAYSILNVHLPHAEDYAGHNDKDIACTLGYVAHLIELVSRLYNLPVRYCIVFKNSRSCIIDQVEVQLLKEQVRSFPLFAKGQEKSAYQYAVYLLNKVIAQLRFDCGLQTADLRKTLANANSLLLHLCGSGAGKLKPSDALNGGKVEQSVCSGAICFSDAMSNPSGGSLRQKVFRLSTNESTEKGRENSIDDKDQKRNGSTLSLNSNETWRRENDTNDSSISCTEIFKTCYLSNEALNEAHFTLSRCNQGFENAKHL